MIDTAYILCSIVCVCSGDSGNRHLICSMMVLISFSLPIDRPSSCSQTKVKARCISSSCSGSNSTSLGTSPLRTDEVAFGGFIVVLEIVPVMDALSVEVPLPRYKPDAALGGVARQHRITEVREDAVVTVQPCWPWSSGARLQRRHVFRSRGGGVDYASAAHPACRMLSMFSCRYNTQPLPEISAEVRPFPSGRADADPRCAPAQSRRVPS